MSDTPRQPSAFELSRPPFRRPTADELNRETDARFWSQTKYKIGDKLDPQNPTDAAQVKVWLATFAEVKHQGEIGTLHLTFDRPEVIKGLADARAAQLAAGHLANAAQVATDPAKRDEHIAEAALAKHVADAKATEVAQTAQHPPAPAPAQAAAAAEAAAAPPPPSAPASDHLAHEQASNPPPPATAPDATPSPPAIAPTPAACPPQTQAPTTPPAKKPAQDSGWKKAFAWGVAFAGIAALLYAASRSSGPAPRPARVPSPPMPPSRRLPDDDTLPGRKRR